MATRLLSFLTDIEHALLKESAANMGPTWDATRMVNYHHGLAQMTLTPPKDAEAGVGAGTVLLQSFLLADGSVCLKAILGWEGNAQSRLISVYSKPQLNWKAEAMRIASFWLAGPAASTTTQIPAQPDLAMLLAKAG
jgi:hypothetical protein